MSVDIRNSDRRRYVNELQAREKEIAAGLLKTSQPASPKAVQENEKRIRREIANSNERRRMQCINAGFSNLKALIPQLDGEKLSKAAILQHATEYITSMEKDKTKLQIQLEHTRRMLSQLGQDRMITDAYVSNSPPPSKRKKRDTESSDEGVGSLSDASDEGPDVQQENVTLRHQLELERQRCAALEERVTILENELLAEHQVKGPHSNAPNDLHAVRLDEQHPHLQHDEALYDRKVVDLSAAHQTLVPSPLDESFLPRHPSQTPERRMILEASFPLDATMQKSNESVHFCVLNGDHPSSAVKLEIITARKTSTLSVEPVEAPADLTEVAMTTAAPTIVSTSTDKQSTRHLHSFCHRDHPRRRHRQQAQMDQEKAEEEEEELRRQQQQMVVTTPSLYRPKHSTQNLENLVEAIRQIEGDRILLDEQKVFEEKHILYDPYSSSLKHEDIKRENSSITDLSEVSFRSSGQDSPLRHHHQQTFEASHPHTALPVTLSPNIIISTSSSNFSEKYPIAARLLHRPLESSFYRPGVIVHKQ